jgi:hypothetical protein
MYYQLIHTKEARYFEEEVYVGVGITTFRPFVPIDTGKEALPRKGPSLCSLLQYIKRFKVPFRAIKIKKKQLRSIIKHVLRQIIEIIVVLSQ